MIALYIAIVIVLFLVFLIVKATLKALKMKDYSVAAILGSSALLIIAACTVVTIAAY